MVNAGKLLQVLNDLEFFVSELNQFFRHEGVDGLPSHWLWQVLRVQLEQTELFLLLMSDLDQIRDELENRWLIRASLQTEKQLAPLLLVLDKVK